MDAFILTNNASVVNRLGDRIDVELLDCSFNALLAAARDRIHVGHVLLTHPLSGSVKPNETPFKSVMLTKSKRPSVDFDSLELIEDAIVTAGKFKVRYPKLTDRLREDFQLIDANLIQGAVESAMR